MQKLRIFSSVFVFFLFASLSPAQSRTAVRDILYSADGSRAAGQLQISWEAFTSADGKSVAAGKAVRRITDGVLDVSLIPNEGAVPDNAVYTVNYLLADGTAYQETWRVPRTGPVPLSAVRSNPPAGPDGIVVPLRQEQLALGQGLVTLLGLQRSATPPVASAAGQCYWDTTAGTNGTLKCSTGPGTIYSETSVNIPDASGTAKGKVQLAGDLAGTAAEPRLASTIPGDRTFTGKQTIGNLLVDGSGKQGQAIEARVHLVKGAVSFSGTGPNNFSYALNVLRDYEFCYGAAWMWVTNEVEIISEGSPDHFKVSATLFDGCNTYTWVWPEDAALQDGYSSDYDLALHWSSLTGHHVGDKWTFTLAQYAPLIARQADGTPVFAVLNDGAWAPMGIALGNWGPIRNPDAHTPFLQAQYGGGLQMITIYDSAPHGGVEGWPSFFNIDVHTGNWIVGYGVGFPATTERYRINGLGKTSSTTGFVTVDSDGADTFRVKDNGDATFGGVVTADGFSGIRLADLPATGTPSISTYLRGDGAWATLAGGDVNGPSSAVSGNFASFNGTGGKTIQDSGSKASDFATAGHTQAAIAGGTGQTTWTLGDLLYSSAADTLAKLPGNQTTTRKFLRQTGDGGGNSAAPAWDTVTKTDVGLGTTATPQFARLGVGAAADASYALNIGPGAAAQKTAWFQDTTPTTGATQVTIKGGAATQDQNGTNILFQVLNGAGNTAFNVRASGAVTLSSVQPAAIFVGPNPYTTASDGLTVATVSQANLTNQIPLIARGHWNPATVDLFRIEKDDTRNRTAILWRVDKDGQTIIGSHAASGSSNADAGAGSISPGTSTGTGKAEISLKRESRASTSGTADNTLSKAIIVPSPVALTDAATSIFTVALAAGARTAGTFSYAVEAADANDGQAASGTCHWAAVNKGDVYTTSIKCDGQADGAIAGASALSGGSTLTGVWTIASGTSNITVNFAPTGSLTETTYRVSIVILNKTAAVVTMQ